MIYILSVGWHGFGHESPARRLLVDLLDQLTDKHNFFRVRDINPVFAGMASTPSKRKCFTPGEDRPARLPNLAQVRRLYGFQSHREEGLTAGGITACSATSMSFEGRSGTLSRGSILLKPKLRGARAALSA